MLIEWAVVQNRLFATSLARISQVTRIGPLPFLSPICFLFLVLILLTSGPIRAADYKTIPWNDDIQKASDIARQGNKPMLLVFWAGWCDPCKKMDREVFSVSNIIETISTAYVPVRINYDSMGRLDRAYDVTHLPTLVFTDSYGTELFAKAGYVNAETLREVLNDFPTDMTAINSFDQVLAVDRNDLNALLGLASELRRHKLYLSSNQFYERALKCGPELREETLILAAEGFNDIELRDPKGAVRAFQRCLKKYPTSPSKPVFMLGLGQAYALAGEDEEARNELNSVITEYPNTAVADKARHALSELP
jgi:thioredoxin-related protein